MSLRGNPNFPNPQLSNWALIVGQGPNGQDIKLPTLAAFSRPSLPYSPSSVYHDGLSNLVGNPDELSASILFVIYCWVMSMYCKRQPYNVYDSTINSGVTEMLMILPTFSLLRYFHLKYSVVVIISPRPCRGS